MPKVGKDKFAYTPKGVSEAKQKSAETGIPVSNAANRGENYQLGGLIPGMTGFGQRPMDVGDGGGNQPEGYNPHLREAGPQDVMQGAEVYYKEGGSIFEKNEAERKRIAEANKKAAAEGKSKRELRKEARAAKRAARKASKQSDKNKKKIEKLKDKDVKVTTTAKTEEDKKKLVYSGKLKDKKNIKEVTVTEGGAYPAYKKDTKQAISFNEKFAEERAKQGPGGVFTWNGRKYTTDRADDKKKVKTKPDIKPKVDKKPKPKTKPKIEPPLDTEFIPGLDEGDTEVNKGGYLTRRKRGGSPYKSGGKVGK